MDIVIYHNPRCSKSRATLQLLEERGLKPVVVNYLEAPPSKEEFTRVLSMLHLKAADVLRKKEAAEEGIDPALPEEELIDAMIRHPFVIERPVVVCGDKAALGRPPEAVLAILPGGK